MECPVTCVTRFVRTIAALTLCAVASAAAADLSLHSKWRDREVVVDGAIADWNELLVFPAGVSIAAINDDRDLFLAIATSDVERRRQLLAVGFIVWLDPAGGRKERYGIRIPGFGMGGGGVRRGVPPDARPGAPGEMRPSLSYIEVLGPGKDDRRRLQLAAESPISAAAAIDGGTLLFELRIPFGTPTESQPYPFAAKAGSTIGLGLVTPKIEREDRRRAGGMGGRGGFGGGGRGRGGGMGGVRGGGMQDRDRPVKDLKMWTTIVLATAPQK
jgi:hypothetical protein